MFKISEVLFGAEERIRTPLGCLADDDTFGNAVGCRSILLRPSAQVGTVKQWDPSLAAEIRNGCQRIGRDGCGVTLGGPIIGQQSTIHRWHPDVAGRSPLGSALKRNLKRDSLHRFGIVAERGVKDSALAKLNGHQQRLVFSAPARLRLPLPAPDLYKYIERARY